MKASVRKAIGAKPRKAPRCVKRHVFRRKLKAVSAAYLRLCALFEDLYDEEIRENGPQFVLSCTLIEEYAVLHGRR